MAIRRVLLQIVIMPSDVTQIHEYNFAVGQISGSGPIDGPTGRVENQRKRYSQFQFTGEADNEMMLQVFKDNEVVPVAEAIFRARESLIPVRVPINRIARRLRFRISGMGPVKIQGMRVGIVV